MEEVEEERIPEAAENKRGSSFRPRQQLPSPQPKQISRLGMVSSCDVDRLSATHMT